MTPGLDHVFSTRRAGVTTRQIELGFRLDTYAQPRIDVQLPMVRHAEALGFHSVWSAEAYGADALSPLAYLAGLTQRIKLGTCIAQIAARPPTTLAMHAMTIDALAGPIMPVIFVSKIQTRFPASGRKS